MSRVKSIMKTPHGQQEAPPPAKRKHKQNMKPHNGEETTSTNT
jgi:hypothetical protein